MASRIQLKRSSILGKRPNNQYLEPGELALNTNQSDPGLFFETNSGDIAKVGPTHIGVQPPFSDVGYGSGETWLDSGNGTMNIWVPALSKWVPVQSPLFGGATTAIFVGTEFPEATDDLSNDGIARPFASLNRACVEVARRSILSGRLDDLYNGQFTIVLLPGRNVVYNEPGVELGAFEELVSGLQPDQQIEQATLRLFNSETGGLVVPRGTSIIALDLRKTEIRPTYYPFWSRSLFEFDPTLIQPRTSILKWTGNCYFTSFTFKDKVGTVSVSGIAGGPDDVAVLRSARPHGFRALVTSSASSSEVIAADRVVLTYPLTVPQLYDGEPVAPVGDYYADPIDAYTFRLRRATDASALLRKELPQYGTPGANPPEYLVLTYPLTTHHRLSAIKYVTNPELNEFYAKVQRAFSLLNFSGTVNNAEVAPGETEIVARLPELASASVNQVANSSPYVFNCSLRSDWGLSGAEVDGDLVGGLRSALFCNFTSVSIQNDSEAYEVYDFASNSWVSLKQRYAASAGIQVESVTNAAAMDYLVSSDIKVENIRFFFRPRMDIPGQDGKSSGLPDQVSDTRNFSIRVSNGGFAQIVSSFAIGVAVNYWATSGGSMDVGNANSNFGGMALRAEGFRGIGTSGGAEPPDQNFVVKGIRRPSLITKYMVEDEANTRKTYLNARIVSATANTITFDTEIDTASLFPYTLRPGSCVWVESIIDGSTYKSFITSTTPVLSADKRTLYVSSNDNGIFVAALGVDQMSLPYIRRFVDPRTAADRQYSLWIGATSSSNRAPEFGYVLRFSQNSSSNLIRKGIQLDPGQNGGWNHLFQVIDTRTKAEGDNPNENAASVVPTSSAGDYYSTLLAVDGFHPWVPSGDSGFSVAAVNYPGGSYSTYGERAFYAMENDQAVVALKPLPTDAGSTVWTRSKNLEYCQSVDEAWIHAEGFASADDPLKSTYIEEGMTYSYPRGIQFDRGNFELTGAIDIDDGSSTFGILSGDTALTAVYDPWWSPTKMAMTRFLSLLGFSYSQIDTMLQPQLWTSRCLAVESMPQVGTTGYALATGQWGVEFNRPSSINSGNHAWKWSGYLNYAKGLPKYQASQLSTRERFDAMFTSVWGGVVSASGTDERDNFLITGDVVNGGNGRYLLPAGRARTSAPA